MKKKLLCRVCKREFKNLRGHLQLMRDEEHQKLFKELYGQKTNPPSKLAGFVVEDEPMPSQEQPPPEQPLNQPVQKQPQIQPQQPHQPVQQSQPIQQQTQQPWIQPQILTAAQPQTQSQQPYNPNVVKKQLIQIPTASLPEPEEWIEQFLSQFENMKREYITFQKIHVQQTRELPNPNDFERDLISFDSGYKGKRPESSYIRTFYEGALRKYMAERDIPPPSRGYGVNYPPQDRGYAPGPGIPVGQQPYGQYGQYDQYGRPIDPYKQQPYAYQSDGRSSELRELKNEISRMREERERRRDEELQNLKMQLQNRPQTDPAVNEFRQRFEQMNQDLQREREERLQERFARVENVARSGMSPEEIQQRIDRAVQSEHDRITAVDMDRKIREAVSSTKSISAVDVDLKRADNEFQIKSREIEAEKEKTNQWGETLKDVAASAGSAFGVAMSNRGKQPPQQGMPSAGGMQPPPTSTGQNLINCPKCGLALELPPNTNFGECPDCGTKMEIDGSGNVMPHRGAQPPPTGQPMPRPTQRPQVEIRDTIPPRPPRPPQTFAPDEYIDMPSIPPQDDFQIKKKEYESPIPPTPIVEIPAIAEEPMPPTQEIYLPDINEASETPAESTLPPGEQDFSNDDDFYGMCLKCGKPVFETGPNVNIGAVEGGKPVCKECWHNGTEPV